MGIFSLFGAGMALQFERHGGDYVYRANGKGPAVPVTEQEAERFIRKGGVSFLLHCAAFMLSVIAAAMLTAVWFPEGGEAGGFVLMGVLLIAIGYALYRSIHWSMLAPARELADRAPVAPERAHRPRSRLRGVAQPAARSVETPRKGGLMIAIAFLIAEVIGGIGSGLLAFRLLSAILAAIAPAVGLDQPIALVGGFIVGMVAVFLIDRQCMRKTGYQWLDLFSVIP